MMYQCIILGYALIAAIMAGFMARAWPMVLAGSILFANWLLWSSTILATGDWEPWIIAIVIDSATAMLLWYFCSSPVLAVSSAHLVMLHYIRAADWIGYDLYYNYGWLVGLAQAGFIIAASIPPRKTMLA